MTEAELLASLTPLAFQAVLVLARLGAAAMLLPGIGEQEVPATVRLGLALVLVALLLPSLAPGLPPPPDAPAEAVRLITIEVLFGLWLGGLARLVLLALAVAGQAIAAMIGLASVLVQDPALGAGGSALSRLFGLLGALFVLSSGLYALPLTALVQSYSVLPVGGAFPAGDALAVLVGATADSLALSLRLAAPFVLFTVLMNLSLGLLARLAPQVQVYFVAVPGQILGGMLMLALLTPALLATFGETARAVFSALPGRP